MLHVKPKIPEMINEKGSSSSDQLLAMHVHFQMQYTLSSEWNTDIRP